MTDEAPRVSRRSVHIYASTGILIGLAFTGLTTWLGTPANSLHSSAQAWGFALLGFSIAAGLGSLAYLDRLPVIRK